MNAEIRFCRYSGGIEQPSDVRVASYREDSGKVLVVLSSPSSAGANSGDGGREGGWLGSSQYVVKNSRQRKNS